MKGNGKVSRIDERRKFMSDINEYRFIVSAVVVEQNNKDKSVKTKRPVIELMNVKSKLITMHSFNEFVFLWKADSYNTMKNKANTIARFLNFILINNSKYNISNFSQLDIMHGEDYLNDLAISGKNIKYVNAEKNTLDKFYRFLYNKGLFEKVTEECIKIFEKDSLCKRKNKKRRTKILPVGESIFQDYALPSNLANPKKLHSLKEEFIIPFLETAIEVEPRIALGVFFQMFGGVRVSEVVNIKRSKIEFHEWGIRNMYVTIGDEIIDETNKDVTQACNKRKRNQKVHNIGNYLPELLYKHLIVEKYFAIDGTDALFSNRKGNLITSNRYYKYFSKIKKEFVKKLMKSEDVEIRHYGIFLNMSKWSTHIGRGVASNFVADATQNEYLLAKFRGDRSLESALPYIEDTKKYQDMIYNSGSRMYEDGIKMNEKLEKKEEE